ncbi:Beta-lactamase precursor [Nocardia farcinica]|uniref:Beta-lactamase n=1 Tax=Nocardia farcinica TaxID=37329 RepID=A0A449GEX6_NOCFR|nr:serine hydrolase domain-containing protein [Nocardia farcinica]VFA91177.1 Beta-lactamase precursor [Nocardia farcinica]
MTEAQPRRRGPVDTIAPTSPDDIAGTCDPRFARVREEFARNFAERGEVGASVCVYLDGEPVVDLWGGTADPATGTAWQRDTVNVVMSATKGAAALCAHILRACGQLDFDAPVAQYWPEFARHGKGGIRVRQVLSHQSGVCHVSSAVPEGGFFDWALMTALIEDTEPFWEPGTRHGYHPFTLGYILGELVLRITGQSIGTFFRTEVAEPLGLDFWIGLPAEHEARVAPSIAWELDCGDPLPPPIQAAIADPESMQARIGANDGGWFGNLWDTRAAHAAELPAAGGITNARGLARMYAPLSLDGALGDVRLVDPADLAGMRGVCTAGDVDAYLLFRTAFSLGFAKSWDNRRVPGHNSMIIGEDAFGAPGAGGQIGFADPSHRLAFGYTMARHGLGMALDPRGQSLIDAVYQTLGSPTCLPGFWVRT